MGIWAGAVREARDQGHAGPDARGQEQQWLSGPVAGAAAAVTMRMARQVEGLGNDIRTRAGACTESPTYPTRQHFGTRTTTLLLYHHHQPEVVQRPHTTCNLYLGCTRHHPCDLLN